MKDGLYHKSLGFPQGAVLHWLGEVKISHTRHSLDQCLRPECRRWVKGGVIDIPEGAKVFIIEDDIVEVEVVGGIPVKALVRLYYDDNSDVCFALCSPLHGVAKCKTLWTLNANDNHKTLDMSKYIRPV